MPYVPDKIIGLRPAGRRQEPKITAAAITATALGTAEEQAAAAGIAVHARLRPAPVAGEPVLLERLVGNLVDNALRYNHADGHLIVETRTAGARAVLRICNTGREIAPEEASDAAGTFRARAGHPRPHRRPGPGPGTVHRARDHPCPPWTHRDHSPPRRRPRHHHRAPASLTGRRAAGTTTRCGHRTASVRDACGTTEEPSRWMNASDAYGFCGRLPRVAARLTLPGRQVASDDYRARHPSARV